MVQATLAPHRQAQIRRPDIEHVEAFDRGDRLDVFEARSGFDLRDGKERLVGLRPIVVAEEAGPVGPEAAIAQPLCEPATGSGA